jgi:hypothetical protein
MTISKKTQTVLGVVAVGALAYYIWDNNRKKDQIFANASGRRIFKRTPPSPIFSDPTYVGESRLATNTQKPCPQDYCKITYGSGFYDCRPRSNSGGICPNERGTVSAGF